jgi:four helix bundle protein
MDDPVGLAEWAANVPQAMREDPIWRLSAYRFALWLGDLTQLDDAPRIQADYRTRKHLEQLLDAVGSISANIAEGYGRTTGPERAKFYEYALSSAREARDWYFKVRHSLDPEVVGARIQLLTRVMKILTVATVRERAESDTRARRAERQTCRPPRNPPPNHSGAPGAPPDHPASPSAQHLPPAPS